MFVANRMDKCYKWLESLPHAYAPTSSHILLQVEVLSGGDEHIVIKPPPGSPLRDLTVGCNLQLIPGHCDPYVGVAGSRLVRTHDP